MANEATEHNLKINGVCKKAIYNKATDLGIGYVNDLCKSSQFRDSKGNINSLLFYSDTTENIHNVYLAVHTCVKNIITVHQQPAIVIELIKLADQLDQGNNKLQPMYYDDGGVNAYKAAVIAVTGFADSDRKEAALTPRQREHVKAFLIHMMHQGKSVILGVNSTKLATVSTEWGVNFMTSLTEIGVVSLKLPLIVREVK